MTKSIVTLANPDDARSFKAGSRIGRGRRQRWHQRAWNRLLLALRIRKPLTVLAIDYDKGIITLGK